MTVSSKKMTESKAKPSRRKDVKPIPETALSNKQLSLFQGFLANNSSERDALSNAVDLWDSVPRYSISKQRMNTLRTPEGFLPVTEIPFKYRGRELTARVYPAQVKDSEGKWVSHYPSAREELVEHALRKIATEQNAGFFDQPNYRSGAKFSLYQLRTELEQQGHSLRYIHLIEALDILSLSSIEIEGISENGDEYFARSTYLAALSGVKRKEYDSDRSARWAAQFHPLVTQGIDKLTYRQFNYRRLMQCSSQLSRWLISQLVLKYTSAALINPFVMKYSTIKRDSALLMGYGRERDAIAALEEAWDELERLKSVKVIERVVEKNSRGKVEDVAYTLRPTTEFVAEQKASNRRQKDANTYGVIAAS
jgi:hypothetical protein